MIYSSPVAGGLTRWRDDLARTRRTAFGRLAAILGATEINQETWDDLEGLLIQADVDVPTAADVINSLRKVVSGRGLRRADELRDALGEELVSRLAAPPELAWESRPAVVLVVGVNGAGKTTTIAKLAQYFRGRGKAVLLGGADTFRAAATEQLQAWGAALGTDVISGPAGSDPGAAAFNAVKSAVARGVDIVILDTAGRLHTRTNLMEELKKVHRVTAKALAGAPHAVWLVVDATTGQNALAQARSFKDAVGVTAVILAKLDASARGGMAFSIQRELNLPIQFVGVGEKVEDLRPFDRRAFVEGIVL
jgi:fused signal recognition particle receptor